MILEWNAKQSRATTTTNNAAPHEPASAPHHGILYALYSLQKALPQIILLSFPKSMISLPFFIALASPHYPRRSCSVLGVSVPNICVCVCGLKAFEPRRFAHTAAVE